MEAYMNQISSKLKNEELNSLKEKLEELESDLSKYEKLIEIATPALDRMVPSKKEIVSEESGKKDLKGVEEEIFEEEEKKVSKMPQIDSEELKASAKKKSEAKEKRPKKKRKVKGPSKDMLTSEEPVEEENKYSSIEVIKKFKNQDGSGQTELNKKFGY